MDVSMSNSSYEISIFSSGGFDDKTLNKDEKSSCPAMFIANHGNIGKAMPNIITAILPSFLVSPLLFFRIIITMLIKKMPPAIQLIGDE
ncbi:MAG: hypothetical protein ACD_65C00052G0001 [uncultured bacterium]|nr:MAG: hypothetical protein ACD_65C00052G0001 [uncultured bacterium]